MEHIKPITHTHKSGKATAAEKAAAKEAIFPKLLKTSQFTTNDDIFKEFKSRLTGLTDDEARARLRRYGFNEVVREKRKSSFVLLLSNVKNPLIILLVALGAISLLTGDMRAAAVIFVMVLLGVVLRFFQELRADRTAEKLKAMVSNTATVIRNNKEKEVALKRVVPGDIILLAAGDMIPADVRILSAKDLFINQAVLTGESMPVEKTAKPLDTTKIAKTAIENPLDLPNICFQGSNVVSGSATAIVIHTGDKTYFGSLAAHIVGQRVLTSFDTSLNKFVWLMIRFIVVLVPIVFFINVISRHNWLDAFFFSLAVAVGLTPEMLPMIVTVNLSKGALTMARKKVIVKRLNAIQNFGAMDVLCTDKTGTITQGKIILERYIDINGVANEKVMHLAYLNSYHHTGLKNLLDEAILNHEELEAQLEAKKKYKKIDEIPFDFTRRRMSVIVEDETGLNTLICKGAVDEIMSVSDKVELDGKAVPMLPEYIKKSKQIVDKLSGEGFRVIALAYKQMPGASDEQVYATKDEAGLILLGFLAFLDPPKETAAEALQRLQSLNVDVKVLTGDNAIITSYICEQVGIPTKKLLLGSQIDTMNDNELAEAAASINIFAKLIPEHKERIILALQSKGHVVGFMGDGINDAPALKAADVGISVDSAVDIAKESSDIILLKNSLLILEKGVVEGRRVFGNIIKYVRMAASSNFGNVLSVVGTSAFLPFLPMLPIQLLTNNLLYDFSQTTIPTDNVDAEWIAKPRKWSIDNLRRFILFIGPISSIFDYITFFIMLYIFNSWNNPELFHTGWFVESLFTQTLIIHVIRTNKIPFIESRASWPLIITSLIIVSVGAWLTVSPLAGALGFVPLPRLFWILLSIILFCYVGLTQLVKVWFIRKFEE